MTEITKPVSHDDDDAFCLMLREVAKSEESEGREHTGFLLVAAADKILLWKERCEAVQADLDRTTDADWSRE